MTDPWHSASFGAKEAFMDDKKATSATTPDSIVDDATYDLLQALTSKLEAIDAYQQYAADTPGTLFERLIQDERRHAQDLLDALRGRLQA
jgi:rubrerythrin